MLMTEYDYDTDIAVQREEAYEDGLNKGITQGISQGIKQGAYEKAVETARLLLSFGDSIEKISTITGLSGETIRQLSKDL